MSLRIHLLGKPRLLRDGQPIDLPGYRPLALLAYLIVTRKPHRRAHLIDLLFDKPDDPQASLRWTLSKLRNTIGSEYILADREEVSFNIQSDSWLDVSAFEAGKLELFEGDFLEGLHLRDAFRYEEWLIFERQRLRGMYQAGLERQLEQQSRKNDADAVVVTANQLLKLDNLREDWQRALILAYAQLGKRGAALEQFEQYRKVLRTELGADPEPETLVLANAIRGGQNRPDLPPIDHPNPQSPVTTAPEGWAIRTMGGSRFDSRPGLTHPILAALGAIGLVAAILFTLSGFFDINSQAAEEKGKQSFTASNPNQQLSDLQESAGTTVTILGPLYDTAAKLFMQSMQPFEERSGIEVVYLSGKQPYETYLKTRLESGDPPDIVAFPQPGWLADYAERGRITDIRTFLDNDYLRQQYPDAFLELATVDDKLIGVWHTVGLKSLVWYPKQAFEANGYEVPETWDELIALSDRIVADGGTPWCIGNEDGEFTGWIGTDWVEDILLRTAPPETYDAWVNHELPFNSPEIRRVFEIMGQIWLNDEYVYGGTANISIESLVESPAHLFKDPPDCYLHKQGSFAPYLFPPTVSYEQEYDFFYLPPIDPEYGNPVLGNGEIFAMFNDRPEVREVMRYLTTAESTEALIKNGNILTPHRDTPIEWYPTAADLRFAQIILSADTYRFDGSDLMPGEVGLGSFYRGINHWVAGADLETVLLEIDKSWPQ